jgi:ribosomal-protein-alanine N-acetyltransferase
MEAMQQKMSSARGSRHQHKRHAQPSLAGASICLRELRLSDAAVLFAHLSSDSVARFISPPPASVEAFERFILWTDRQREAGAYVSFAITLPHDDQPIGLFQIRELERGFSTAEWGFALAPEFWGTGVFQEGAELLLDYAFDTLGVHRLEARASVSNGRGNGALRKLCAVQEGHLRGSFLRNGTYQDQVLWTLLDEDWRHRRADARPAPIPAHRGVATGRTDRAIIPLMVS